MDYTRFSPIREKIPLVADDWYKYRDARFKAIAIDWCKAHGLAYTDDTRK